MNSSFLCYSSSSKPPYSSYNNAFYNFSVFPKYWKIILFKAIELKKAKNMNQYGSVDQKVEIEKRAI